MNPDKSVVVAIKTLHNQFHRHMLAQKGEMAKRFKEIGQITEVQGRIIEYLFDRQHQGPIFQKDVERHFHIRRSTATTALQRMEKVGLIRRVVSAEDARMKELVLTARAKSIHPKARAEIRKAEARATRGLSGEEVEAFLRTIATIIRNIS